MYIVDYDTIETSNLHRQVHPSFMALLQLKKSLQLELRDVSCC